MFFESKQVRSSEVYIRIPNDDDSGDEIDININTDLSLKY